MPSRVGRRLDGQIVPRRRDRDVRGRDAAGSSPFQLMKALALTAYAGAAARECQGAGNQRGAEHSAARGRSYSLSSRSGRLALAVE